MIHQILEEINFENGSKYKISVLQKYKDNELLKRVLKMTYDRVQYTYGITMKNVNYNKDYECVNNLEYALDVLEHKFCTREYTGNKAIEELGHLLNSMYKNDAKLIEKILDRDLKLFLGKTQINKVFKNLIVKPSYMRCELYNQKTAKNISYPAVVQLKADGTYREFTIENGEVQSRSRSGESYEYPILFEQMKNFPDGVYVGELTVKNVKDRHEANGLLDSDNPPHEDIIAEFWDYITLEEYAQAAKKDRKNPCTIKYENRLVYLQEILFKNIVTSENIKIIPSKTVNSLKEALEYTSQWMKEGFEGSILKDLSGVFKDGTSKYQLKLKVEMEIDVRITGFTEGKKGTKTEKWFGAIQFETDDKLITGQCSGFTEQFMEETTPLKDQMIGKVMTIKCNDITKSDEKGQYKLHFPKFVDLREKDETDDLERVLKIREMAMELS